MNRFINLDTHSYCSIKETVVTPTEIVRFAVKDGARAIALTDFNSVRGFLEFFIEATHHKGFKPIYGVQIIGMDPPKSSIPRKITLLAKNQNGLRNLYRIMSSGYQKVLSESVWPCVSYKDILENHEGVVVGLECTVLDLYQLVPEDKEPCENKKLKDLILKEFAIADYVEIKPWQAYMTEKESIGSHTASDHTNIPRLLSKMIGGLKDVRVMAIASNGANCITEQDELCYNILHEGALDKNAHVSRFLTTEEMLEEYRFLGRKTATEIVLDNPNAIAEMIERVDILGDSQKQHPFSIDNADEILRSSCNVALHGKYGDSIPDLILDRFNYELNSILSHGFSSQYVLAAMLAKKSRELGYLHNTRGCAGGSLIAYLLGVVETNPLPPHYYCSKCRQVEFVDPLKYPSGFDLNCIGADIKICGYCGEKLSGDGHNIPVEFFSGADGERAPNFSFNFASEIHKKMINYLGEIVGNDRLLYEGKTERISPRIADYLIENYCVNHSVQFDADDTKAISYRLTGVCRDNIRCPGGIVILPKNDDIYDYTPVLYHDPSEVQSSEFLTTSADDLLRYSDLTVIHILSHHMFSKIKHMEEQIGVWTKVKQLSEIDFESFFMRDSFHGLPFNEMFAHIIHSAVIPAKFSELLAIDALAHGRNVWKENAEKLIAADVPLKDLITTKEDVMLTLLRYGIDRRTAFELAELVGDGEARKYLTTEQEALMKDHGIPDWYIKSMKKVSYLFPKAHVIEYLTNYLRMIWFKINYPSVFSATVLCPEDAAQH